MLSHPQTTSSWTLLAATVVAALLLQPASCELPADSCDLYLTPSTPTHPMSHALLQVASSSVAAEAPGLPQEVRETFHLNALPHSAVMFNTTSLWKGPNWKDNFHLLHIEKTGGTTIEKMLGVGHQGHDPMWIQLQRFQLQGPRFDKLRWVTVIREPVDRLVSDYYFQLSGENQPNTYKDRQRTLCYPKTGIDFGKPCKPMFNFYEFASDPKKHNHQWAMVAATQESHKPQVCQRMDIWKTLLEKFWIVGTMERFPELQVLIAHGLNLKAGPSISMHANAARKRDRQAANLVDEQRLHYLTIQNGCDGRLHEAADHFLSQLVIDFGEQRMRNELKQLSKDKS